MIASTFFPSSDTFRKPPKSVPKAGHSVKARDTWVIGHKDFIHVDRKAACLQDIGSHTFGEKNANSPVCDSKAPGWTVWHIKLRSHRRHFSQTLESPAIETTTRKTSLQSIFANWLTSSDNGKQAFLLKGFAKAPATLKQGLVKGKVGKVFVFYAHSYLFIYLCICLCTDSF